MLIILVMHDIVGTMFNKRFMEELFKPQDTYSKKAMRTVFDRLAHASIMRLNSASMDKVRGLMWFVWIAFWACGVIKQGGKSEEQLPEKPVGKLVGRQFTNSLISYWSFCSQMPNRGWWLDFCPEMVPKIFVQAQGCWVFLKSQRISPWILEKNEESVNSRLWYQSEPEVFI